MSVCKSKPHTMSRWLSYGCNWTSDLYQGTFCSPLSSNLLFLQQHFCVIVSLNCYSSVSIIAFFRLLLLSAAFFQCAPGYYTLSNGTVTCQSCPAGFRCPSTDQAPIACSNNEVSSAPTNMEGIFLYRIFLPSFSLLHPL